MADSNQSTQEPDYRPDYMKNAQQKMQASQQKGAAPQNPWKGNGEFEKKTVSYMAASDLSDGSLYSPGGNSRFGGYLLFILGIAGMIGAGAGLLTVLLASAVTGAALTSLKVVLVIVILVFAGVTWKGSGTLKKIRNFKNYVKLIGKRESVSISELASSRGRSDKEVLSDIREMMHDAMFLQGHLDQEGKTLFVTNASYEAYQKGLDQKAQQQQKALEIQERQQQLPEEVQKLLKDGRGYVAQIKADNEAIQDANVSQKLDGLEASVTKILDYVEEHPDSADETKKLMRYYLPTTVKLLDSYQNLTEEQQSGEQPTHSESMEKSKKEIEDTLDTLNQAFGRLYDGLYQDTSMDISADISVLNTLLAQEGLTGEEVQQALKGVK